MAGKTITAANSILLLSIEGLFDVPQQLQGFAADDVFDTETIAPAETMMGVDGHLSGGFVFNPIRQNIALQADSDSNRIFEAWIAAMVQSRETYIANGQVQLQAIQRKYAMARGFLTSIPPTPAARKVLQPRRYQITWERITAAPY
jgi:hypothetical protein